MTDQNEVLLLQRAYYGAVSDSEMDRDTVEFLAGREDAPRSTLVADSKIVNGPLIELMAKKGFGLVSKCPRNLGDRVRADIERSVLSAKMEPRSYCDGWEVYDFDAEVDDIQLRFVALHRRGHRTRHGVSEGPG